MTIYSACPEAITNMFYGTHFRDSLELIQLAQGLGLVADFFKTVINPWIS
jgi:hypothetical protein